MLFRSPLLWGIWLVDGRVGLRLPWRILAWTISIAAIAMFTALAPSLFSTDPQASLGGVVGQTMLAGFASVLESFGIPTPSGFAGILAGLVGVTLFIWSIGINPLRVPLPALPWDSLGQILHRGTMTVRRAFTKSLRPAPRIARQEPRIISAYDDEPPQIGRAHV